MLKLKDGFTLIETVLIIVILGFGIPTVLTFFIQGAKDSSHALIFNVAQALSRGLLEEIKSKKWDENSPVPTNDYSASLGSDSETRSTFDDVDDYNGLNESPPKDSSGNNMDYDTYGQSVSVCYVTDTDLNTCSAAETNYKKVTITVNVLDNTGPPLTVTAIVGNYR